VIVMLLPNKGECAVLTVDSCVLHYACRARTGNAEGDGKAIGSSIQNFKDKHPSVENIGDVRTKHTSCAGRD
jgi:hypothetical protein